MFKKVLAILFSSVIMTVLIGCGIHLATTEEENELMAVINNENTVNAAQEQYDKFKELYDNVPEGIQKDVFGQQTTEAKFQNYLHYMANQKVKSDLDKELVLLINQDRIVCMINILHNNYDRLKMADVYADILYRWYEGDFSQIEKDHDEIWAMRRGEEKGMSTRLLTPEEEAKLIEYGNDPSKNKGEFYFYNTNTN